MASKKLGGKFNCLSRRGKLLSASDIFWLVNKSNGAFWCASVLAALSWRGFFAFVMLLEDALAEMVRNYMVYKTKWCKTTSKRVLAWLCSLTYYQLQYPPRAPGVSQVVFYPSTILTQCCLTSVIQCKLVYPQCHSRFHRRQSSSVVESSVPITAWSISWNLVWP